jgi:hypothetical protein
VGVFPGTTRLLVFVMRAIGNFYSEWAPVQRKGFHHAFFVGSVACAIGATASAAVMLSLVGSPVTVSGIPSTSVRAIVRNADIFEAPKTVQDRPMIEAPLRPATTETASGRDEPVTQTEAVHQAGVHGDPRKHSRVVIHSRKPYWGRFSHAVSPGPRLSSW